MGTLANSEDPDEMQHHAAFHQGLSCFLRFKQSSATEISYNLENSTCYPLKYTMSSPILIVSICMGKSIRIQRVMPRLHLPYDEYTMPVQCQNYRLCAVSAGRPCEHRTDLRASWPLRMTNLKKL